MIELLHVQPLSPEWFALRRRDLTSSKLGAVEGLDPFSSPYDVWAEKAGLASPPETEAMILGNWHEPAVAAAVRAEFPDLELEYPVARYSRIPAIRLGGTVDALGRFVSQPDELVAFEFKIVSNRHAFDHYWSEGAPITYQIQTAANVMLNGAAYGFLVGLVLGDTKPLIYRIECNPAVEARIHSIAVKFWRAFDAGHAPRPDYERDGNTIKALFPPRKDVPAPIDLSGDNMLPDLLDHREILKTTISRAKKDCDTIDAEIRHKLAGAERATLSGWKISNTMTHRDEQLQPAADYPVLRVARTKEISA